MKRARRPGYLRFLGDSWTNIDVERGLSRQASRKLETLSKDYIDTRSGAARGGRTAMDVISRPVNHLSAPEFLMQNSKWYRDYMAKVLQNTREY